MPIKDILTIILIIDTIAMIAIILSQQNRDAGFGIAGEGNRNSYWEKNKSRTLEGRMTLLARLTALAFFILSAVICML